MFTKLGPYWKWQGTQEILLSTHLQRLSIKSCSDVLYYIKQKIVFQCQPKEHKNPTQSTQGGIWEYSNAQIFVSLAEGWRIWLGGFAVIDAASQKDGSASSAKVILQICFFIGMGILAK